MPCYCSMDGSRFIQNVFVVVFSGEVGQHWCCWCCWWKLLHYPGPHLEHHPFLPGNLIFQITLLICLWLNPSFLILSVSSKDTPSLTGSSFHIRVKMGSSVRQKYLLLVVFDSHQSTAYWVIDEILYVVWFSVWEQRHHGIILSSLKAEVLSTGLTYCLMDIIITRNRTTAVFVGVHT